jgi:predicted porin
MQKKLLSLAIAGALAIPGAAMADVGTKSGADITIYGQIHASWDYLDHDTDTTEINATSRSFGTGDDSDDNTAVFRNSRLGFRGAEDLGYGFKGIWQAETQLSTGDNDVRLRNTFVGLSHSTWGEIRLGRHDTPYKTSTAKLDIFEHTVADYNNILGVHMAPAYTYGSVGANTADVMSVSTDNGATVNSVNQPIHVPALNFNERASNLLMYITPKIYGFEGRLARESFSIDEENTFIDGANNPTGWDDEYETWSLSATYERGPMFLAGGYELFRGHNNNNAAGDNDLYAWKVGFGYELGNSKIGFIYEDINHDGDDDEYAFDTDVHGTALDGTGEFAYGTMSRDAFVANFSHKFGANVVKLAYGKADDSDRADADDGADMWAAGVEHIFSNRTKVYAIYTLMDNDQDGNYGLYNPGNTQATMRNSGGDKDNYYIGGNGAGDDISAFSVGIVHTF